MRKEQSDFGWDWGPAFAPAGPWLPAYVIQLGRSEIYPRNVLIDVYRRGQRNNRIPDQTQPWVLNCSIDFLGHLSPYASVAYTLQSLDGEVIVKGSLSEIERRDDSVSGLTIVDSRLVELWWPHE